jgi:indole-3-glycerol phosphate synthase
MGVLEEIVKTKKERLKNKKSSLSLRELKAKSLDMPATLDFTKAIKRDSSEGIKLIGELKKASPSKGVIRKDFDPLEIARIYEDAGAAAISVLTEEDYFMGSLSYLEMLKERIRLPLLRKDFLFDEYQIYESRASRADAVLLIDAILSRSQAEELIGLATELNLSVLYEVHHYKELERALDLDVSIIGINNRNLKTLEIDLNTTMELLKDIPEGKIVVSESGINTKEDVRFIESLPVDAILIGTALMQAADIEGKIKELFW